MGVDSKYGRWTRPESLDRRNIRAAIRPLVLLLAFGLALAGVVLAAYAFFDIRPVIILDDPAAVMSAPWYVGAINALGIIFWSAAAAMSLLAGVAAKSIQPAAASFLRAFGLLTVVLMLDDQYMFHERVARFELGIPENLTLLSYILLTVFVAARYGRLVLRHPDAFVLYSALPFFGLSLVIDVLGIGTIHGFTAAEEYSKFLGILCWALFAGRAGLRVIRDDFRTLESSSVDGDAPADKHIAGSPVVGGSKDDADREPSP